MSSMAEVGGSTRSITALHISQLLDWLQAGKGYSSIQVGQPSPAANTYFFHPYIANTLLDALASLAFKLFETE